MPYRTKPPQPDDSLWVKLMRVPPVLTAMATVGSIVGGGIVAYWELRMTDQEHTIHLVSIDKKLDDGKVKREKDHDLLWEMAGDVKALRVMIEGLSRKANYDRAERP